jgi:hypothetical protein
MKRPLSVWILMVAPMLMPAQEAPAPKTDPAPKAPPAARTNVVRPALPGRRVIQVQPKTVRTTGPIPYEVEAIVVPRENGQYTIDANITQTTTRDGKSVKRAVARPRITTALGGPASTNISPEEPEGENVFLTVEMPKEAEGKVTGKVVIKRGEKVLGEAKFQLPLNGGPVAVPAKN